MDYTIRLLRKCKEYGFRVYMDPHQDVVSAGGSHSLSHAHREKNCCLASFLPWFTLFSVCAAFSRSSAFFPALAQHKLQHPSFYSIFGDLSPSTLSALWLRPSIFRTYVNPATFLSWTCTRFILNSISGLDTAAALARRIGLLQRVV
jgi:hypothetical protein